MRIKEILQEEDVVDDIRSDLMDLIVTYKNAGKDEIPMTGPEGALAYLKRIGHNISPVAMMDVMAGEEFSSIVQRSTPEMIMLAPDASDSMVSGDELERSQEKVDKTATKVAKSAVKSGDNL